MPLSANLASTCRDNLRMSGTGHAAMLLVDQWIAANPAGTVGQLYTYLAALPASVAVVGTIPGDGLSCGRTVNPAGVTAKLAAAIAANGFDIRGRLTASS